MICPHSDFARPSTGNEIQYNFTCHFIRSQFIELIIEVLNQMYKFSTLEKDKICSLVFPYGYVSRLVELSLPTALLTTIAFRARISEDLWLTIQGPKTSYLRAPSVRA